MNRCRYTLTSNSAPYIVPVPNSDAEMSSNGFVMATPFEWSDTSDNEFKAFISKHGLHQNRKLEAIFSELFGSNGRLLVSDGGNQRCTGKRIKKVPGTEIQLVGKGEISLAWQDVTCVKKLLFLRDQEVGALKKNRPKLWVDLSGRR